jgi:hypothetical protein
VTTVPDIPVVQLPAVEPGPRESMPLGEPASVWSVEVPHSRRLTPVTLAALGVVAGIAAMALGAAAVLYAASGAEPAEPTRIVETVPAAAPARPAVERRALALLAKPSTERVVFRGSSGLVLAVGSSGRAAILIRGLVRAPHGTSYGAWALAPGCPPVRVARFTGAERAVFLTRPLGPRASVVVATRRPAATPGRNPVVALRG